MDQPNPPLPSPSPSVKREFSAPPNLIESAAIDTIAKDDLGTTEPSAVNALDEADRSLLASLNQALAKDDHLKSQGNGTENQMQNAEAGHPGSVDEENSLFIPRETNASSQPTPSQSISSIFPAVSDVSDFSDIAEDNLSEAGSDAEYVPGSHETPSKAKENVEPANKPKKKRRSPAKTAREYHKRRQLNMTPAQKRSPAFKRGLLEKIKLRARAGGDPSRKRKHNKLSPKQKRLRMDPSVFLHGDSSNRQSNDEDQSNMKPAEKPNVPTGSSKAQFWKNFVEKNPGMDLHKCRTEFRQMDSKSASFGYGQVTMEEVTMDDGSIVTRWKLKGMSSRLYNHQLIGAAFMVERECSEEGPFGSICADDMGMGKTVQTVATIVGNPPTEEHIAKNEKTTLIVVPSSLRTQWLAEIRKHAPILGENTMNYKSSNEDNTATRLKSNDIVLTTYWELCQSIPQPAKWLIEEWRSNPKVNEFQKLQKWVENHKNEMGLLHQVDWYRIVLDECHFIKNYLSRTSRAACWLKGTYRLLLSGTPIMNRYSEFYSLLTFLKEPLTKDLSPEAFGSKLCDERDADCVESLSIILSDLIIRKIRRTMKDELFGNPIIELPQDHRDIGMIKMSPVELMLQAVFEVRLKELRAMNLGDNDPRKKLRHRLAQLTRLRQMTANIDIISQQMILVFEVDELKALQQKIKEKMMPRKKGLTSILYDRFEIWIREKKNNVYKAASEADDEAICLKCQDATEDLLIIKCKHTFCQSCLEDGMERDMEDEDEVMLCPKCLKPYTETKPYYPSKGSGKNQTNQSKKKVVKKGKDMRGFRPVPAANQLCFLRWLEKLDSDRFFKILPCAKLVGVMDQVQDWIHTASEDKIIVFTQFRHFQTMIGCALEKKKIGFVYFSGDMNSKQREKAIEMFRDREDIQVMVAGLKCGGLGLNLNFANRVIVTDIWWNSCIDNQAFGRVFRIGQEKQTYFVKMVAEDTVDSRLILTLQKKKEQAIGEVMQDDLTEEELDEILGGADESFEEFMDNMDQDPRFRNEVDDSNDDFVDIDDV